MYDFCVIGGGVIGCAIARELSKYESSVVLVEKEMDVCAGTSGANSGIVHGGFDAPVGSLMAKFNVEGASLFDELSRDLDFSYKKTGSIVISTSDEESAQLEVLLCRGKQNGVKSLRIISRSEVIEKFPGVSEKVKQALYVENSGIVNPFELTYAFKENAEANGVKFIFDFFASEFKENGESGLLTSADGKTVEAKCFINAAGVGSGSVSKLFGEEAKLTYRKGEYILFDHPSPVAMPIFQTPSEKGKGVLICPTTSDNWFVGPTAINMDEPSSRIRRSAEDELLEAVKKSVSSISLDKKITSFAGIRTLSKSGDFVIGKSKASKYLYNVIGICSPGLSSAPAIAKYVAESFNLNRRTDFNPIRTGIVKFSHLTSEGKKLAIEKNKKYGNIVCRCEVVSEAEIIEAIRRGARNVDGIKKRLRTGMGRCQGGFCLPRIIEILSRELDVSPESIVRKERGSNYLFKPEAMYED
ncbi:MAG: NAD(P)/FAD-dependent oxidoreductase [Clostridia bacterium]|nr:NAD(P)/FAD-dependent oxidoreductase [Clostridia bacterium]